MNKKKGNVIIETAIAIVILLGVFIATIFFFTAYRTKIVLEMAAREGSREIQQRNPNSTFPKAHKELDIGNVAGADVKPTATGTGVTASKPYVFYAPIIGKQTFNLKGSADFRKEAPLLYYTDP